MPDGSTFKIEVPLTVEPWRKVLLDAADYIERNGWWQPSTGVGENNPNAACPINAVPFKDCYPDGPLSRFARFLNLRDEHKIPEWNDAPGRTAVEVCAALRSCAES